MADAVIPLDRLNDLTIRHREAITAKLKAFHETVDPLQNVVIGGLLNELHATMATGDQALVDAINSDGKPRARPMDGGGGEAKNPPKNG